MYRSYFVGLELAKMNQQWSKDLLTMVQKLNNFIYSESKLMHDLICC